MDFANSRSNTKDSGSRDTSVPAPNSGRAAVTILQGELEREAVLPDSPASDAPSHVEKP